LQHLSDQRLHVITSNYYWQYW